MAERIYKGWHFVGPTLRDGSPVPPDGEWLRWDGPVKPCLRGLHWSPRLIDALRYAPGSTICRVEGRVDVVSHGSPIDKYVGRERRILWRVDGDAILREAARRFALTVIHIWDAPDVVVRYLRTGDESLRDASWAASLAPSLAASRAASWAAGRDASWDASWAAGRAAGRAASRAHHNRILTGLVMAAHRKEVSRG